MKQYRLIIIFSLFILSCSEKKAKNRTSTQEAIETKVDEAEMDITLVNQKVLSEKKLVKQETIINEPSVAFKKFVLDLEDLNWVADTNRLRKVRIYQVLDRESVRYFNNRPFYPIKFKKSEVYSAYTNKPHSDYLNISNVEIFKGVKNIWGYFYRKKETSDLISDGVIEQWEFATNEEAEIALKQLLKKGGIIYFNTNPYFCRIGNKLMIFHTRSMGFSYDQKPLFQKFSIEHNKITQPIKDESIFIDSINFKYFSLKKFDLRNWYYGRIIDELKPFTTKEKLVEYFQNDSLLGDNIYPNNNHFFSIQKNKPSEKIITILAGDEVCCHELHYLVYDSNNELLSDNIIAGTGGDGGWRFKSYGQFVNDSTYTLTRIDSEEVQLDNGGTTTQIDSVITNYRFYKDKPFVKLTERNFEKTQNN